MLPAETPTETSVVSHVIDHGIIYVSGKRCGEWLGKAAKRLNITQPRLNDLIRGKNPQL